MPRPIYGLCVGLLAIACDGGDVPRFPATVSAVDVHHFAAAWIRRKDSTCTAFRSYFDSASMGLRAYASKFHVGADEVCASVRRSPDRYVTVVANVSAFDSAAVQVESVFTRYRMLDPSARMPSVYFVVGNAIAGGATTRGRDPIILIGAELNATAKGMSWIIAHELAHT